MGSDFLLPRSHWMRGMIAEPQPDSAAMGNNAMYPGPWLQISCAALCLFSIYLAAKTVARYRRYLDDDSHPASESPAMFLLSWLATSDIVTAAATLCLLLYSNYSDYRDSTETSKVEPYVSMVLRVALGAQICYFLVVSFLSFHIMCIFDIFSQNIDAAICDYYGPAAGSFALMLSYRLITGISIYPTIFLSVIPVTSISLLVIAATLASRVPRPKTRLVDVHIDESDVTKVRVDLDSYAYFSQVAAGLILTIHLPWIIWGHSLLQSKWVVALAYAGICIRGVCAFVLSAISPAATMHVVEDDNTSGHEHQE